MRSKNSVERIVTAADERAQRDGETKGEVPARRSHARGALHLFGPPRGTGVSALTGTGCPAPAGSAAAESGRVVCSVFTELSGGESESCLLPVQCTDHYVF